MFFCANMVFSRALEIDANINILSQLINFFVSIAIAEAHVCL